MNRPELLLDHPISELRWFSRNDMKGNEPKPNLLGKGRRKFSRLAIDRRVTTL